MKVALIDSRDKLVQLFDRFKELLTVRNDKSFEDRFRGFGWPMKEPLLLTIVSLIDVSLIKKIRVLTPLFKGE